MDQPKSLGATQNVLSNEQFQLIDGNNTEENPGINTNNRLIWVKYFYGLRKISCHPRYVLWMITKFLKRKVIMTSFERLLRTFKGLKSTAYNLDFN
ncbi:MAG: hypothetical protein CM15mP32_5020 [Flavobacteriaceae bacterium]|nr:MAG: hypothetical protein CM15mP32_5020 [Flavobacteriaceae bacterium]